MPERKTPGQPPHALTPSPPGEPQDDVHGIPVRFPFLSELKRRNVGRVAILYLVACWLILQPVSVVFQMLEVPAWANRLVVIVMALGFPAALISAWVFELTPDGIKPAAEVERPQSITAQTGQRLNRAIIAVMGLALAYFVADKFWLSKRVATSPSTAATKAEHVAPSIAATVSDKSIAVLPFLDMSENKDQEYFSDGLSEELIDLITKIPELHVPARTSSFYFKGKQTTIADIARALNVAHVLEGSVRKSGDTVRVTAQLIRADNGYHLWSETYDRKLDDIFKIQDDIANAVVTALRVSLLGAEMHAEPTVNAEAYTLYLKGRDASRRYTRADNDQAVAYLQQSVSIDPNYAPAWSSLGAAYSAAFGLFGTQSGYMEASRNIHDAAQRALALDPTYGHAHAVLGAALLFIDFDFASAQGELARALELAPKDVDVLGSASLLAGALGNDEEAIRLGRSAVALDPLGVDPYRALGMAEYFAGHLSEAETVFRQVLELNPTVEAMHYRLGLVLLARGDPEGALAEMEREPSTSRHQIGLALAYDALGRRAESDVALAKAEKDHAGWNYQIAQIYAHRGDVEHAFEWLDRAYADRDTGLPQYLKRDPLLVSLRADPRYTAMLEKLKLPL